MEQFERIRRDRRDEGLSIRQLARRHRVHRRTVRAALANAVSPARKVPVRTAPVLGPYEDTVRAWLIADKDAPRKQRHTARRVWQRLVEEQGVEVAESSVRALVAKIRAEIGTGLLRRERRVPEDRRQERAVAFLVQHSASDEETDLRSTCPPRLVDPGVPQPRFELLRGEACGSVETPGAPDPGHRPPCAFRPHRHDAIGTHGIGRWLRRRRTAQRNLDVATGGIFIGLGVRLAAQRWRDRVIGPPTRGLAGGASEAAGAESRKSCVLQVRRLIRAGGRQSVRDHRMGPAELLDDHRLAVVGRPEQQQVRHPPLSGHASSVSSSSSTSVARG